jgi:hypothetical protein
MPKGRRIGVEFLTAEAVVQVVKHYAERVGFKSEESAGYSLLAGFLTSGTEAGASILKLAEASRYKSMDMLPGYVRRAELFENHAGAGL